ncbi:MAG: DUF4131 domain-containing protein, partial [Acetobacter sp.]|uniref:DUF4131 domain-containing protein n=3 Tax=Acetobacter sp. TaxID=440 RepID=UPI0039EADBDF
MLGLIHTTLHGVAARVLSAGRLAGPRPVPLFFRLCAFFAALVAAEQRRLVLWVPVGVAVGAWLYFALPVEPDMAGGLLVPLGVFCAGLGAGLLFRHRLGTRVVAGGCVSLAAGFLLASHATHRQPPMPELPRRGVEITGVAVAVTHAAPATPGGADIRWLELGGAVFHTYLTQDMQPLRRTLRLRLRAGDATPLAPGVRVRVRVVLRPPREPALPGGRDPQFEAWFSGQAGNGMLLSPVQVEVAGAAADSGPDGAGRAN